MSNTETDPSLYESLECPVTDGHRLIQHLAARTADVGGIPVSRLMPQRGRRMIGAWCFLDHAGPAVFSSDSQGLKVGPHPHTGLQTFTWMLAGEILHRDSLGSEQIVRPGEVNLMTAGYGIAHTEASLAGESELHAAQLWIALPYADRNTVPRFDHYPDLPRWQEQGAEIVLLVGRLHGHAAPTLAFSPLVGADLFAAAETSVQIGLQASYEYGVLVLEGRAAIGRDSFEPNELAYLGGGQERITIELAPGARVLVLGGEPLDDDIFIWWNFVGHSREDIARAQRQWELHDDRFGDVRGFDGPRLMPPPIPWRTRR
ncbi:pirin family protein [Salinisphaera sp. T31B1]|uniref:pirin family protein n=1 Tax=Salinisphaera sp. T31B1 TaxID=727963 RepID=UPI0033424885